MGMSMFGASFALLYYIGMLALGAFVLYQIIWRAVRRGILAARDDSESGRHL